MSATARDTIRNQVMRFADPADMDVGNWDICTDNILSALDAAGFQCVPKVPTEAMLTAMHEAWISWKGEDFDRWNHCLIAAMLAASTEPPKEPPNE